jgi:outer membrane receptor protein involved in Fe transport
LPWSYSLDLSAVYKPAAIEGLAVRADVFNVLNTQKVLSVDEQFEDTSGYLPTYGRPISYSEPRSVRLTVSYDF